MRCLIVVQNYPPEIGPLRYTFDLADALNKPQNKITVLTGVPHYPTGNFYQGYEKSSIKDEDGVTVIRTVMIRASNSQPLKRILGFISFFLSAIPHLIKNRKQDLAIVSIPPVSVLFTGLLLKLFFRIPLIILARDLEPYSALNTRKLVDNKIINFLIKSLMQFYKGADAVVLVHPDQLNTLDKLGLHFKRVKIIPHTINKKIFQIAQDYSRQSETVLKGLYLGTFGKIHGLPKFLRMLCSKELGDFPVEFEFIGDGQDRIECEKITAGNNNIRISPAVPFNQVFDKLKGADFLIYSKDPEVESVGLGAKFYEYLASARPILAWGGGSASEMVKNIGNGWCIESPYKDNLYACLKNIANEATQLDSKGALGRLYLDSIIPDNFENEWRSICSEFALKDYNFR